MSKKAVIDLGTNTFNLIIVNTQENGSFKMLFHNRIPVKLGKGGINQNMIHRDAIQRGIKALEEHYSKIKEFEVKNVKAIGTSALRSATNGPEFIQLIKDKIGIEVELVTGETEAELIYLGVKQAINFKKNEKFLILDIGGGSNELILGDDYNMLWKQSYDLGIARLLEKFSPSNPITHQEYEDISGYLTKELTSLFTICEEHKPSVLIGASGSFETYISMILHEKYGDDNMVENSTCLEIFKDDFDELCNRLIHSTIKERRKMPGLPEFRIEMIVLASIFTRLIIEKCDINQVIFSAYALKEGAISLMND